MKIAADIKELVTFQDPSVSHNKSALETKSSEESLELHLENKTSSVPKECEIKEKNKDSVTYEKAYDYDIGNVQTLFISPALVDEIIHRGPENLPNSFPDDATGHRFPKGILEANLKNGEKIKRNWLVWSRSKNALFCYPCRLFSKFPEAKRSALALPSGYSTDKKWKKLHDRIPEHENSNNHRTCYLDWSVLETRLQNQTTIDFLLSENIKNEIAQWNQILKRILDVTLFLAERGLAFRGTSSAVGVVALRSFCTIPVSVAQGERSFSLLARIKNVLRSTMCQGSLSSLGVLALESSLARKLNFNELIFYFANQKARKAHLK